jgi:ClpP class serine protease
MRGLWAIDTAYSSDLSAVQDMSFSVQDRKDLETAFEEMESPYWVEGSTAYIKIQGVLSRQWTFETWLLGGLPTGYLQHVFQQAAADAAVSQIMLYVDSPGGEVSGLSEFAQIIRECPKAVHAHISGHCTSGAYWLASQANRISASKTSMIGSIGAFISFRKVKDSGFEEVIYRSSEYKAPDPESDEGRSEYQKLVSEIADLFEADVAEGRGVSTKTVGESYGKGKVFLAEQAHSLGLIDEVINSTDIAGTDTHERIEIGGSMKTEEQIEDEAVVPAKPAADEHAKQHAGAEAERERIKGILALGGTEEITNEAIESGWNIEKTAMKVNAYLQGKLDEMRSHREEDAKVLDDLKQEPAGDVVVTKHEKNIFGIDRESIDAELDRMTGKGA